MKLILRTGFEAVSRPRRPDRPDRNRATLSGNNPPPLLRKVFQLTLSRPASAKNHPGQFTDIYCTQVCSGSEAGSCLWLIDSSITQPKAQWPSRTCDESKEEEEDHPGHVRHGLFNMAFGIRDWTQVPFSGDTTPCQVTLVILHMLFFQLHGAVYPDIRD